MSAVEKTEAREAEEQIQYRRKRVTIRFQALIDEAGRLGDEVLTADLAAVALKHFGETSFAPNEAVKSRAKEPVKKS